MEQHVTDGPSIIMIIKMTVISKFNGKYYINKNKIIYFYP